MQLGHIWGNSDLLYARFNHSFSRLKILSFIKEFLVSRADLCGQLHYELCLKNIVLYLHQIIRYLHFCYESHLTLKENQWKLKLCEIIPFFSAALGRDNWNATPKPRGTFWIISHVRGCLGMPGKQILCPKPNVPSIQIFKKLKFYYRNRLNC